MQNALPFAPLQKHKSPVRHISHVNLPSRGLELLFYGTLNRFETKKDRGEEIQRRRRKFRGE